MSHPRRTAGNLFYNELPKHLLVPQMYDGIPTFYETRYLGIPFSGDAPSRDTGLVKKLVRVAHKNQLCHLMVVELK